MLRERNAWVWHMGAGVVVLGLLTLHMAVMHLDGLLGWWNPAGGHPIDWANVAARARSVLGSISYVLLLGAALVHGLYGLRGILYELSAPARLQKLIDATLLLGGLFLFALGSWAAWASWAAAQTP